MKNTLRIFAGVSVGTAIAALAAAPGWTQGGSGPVARYTIDAGTTPGMAAMAAGGGGGAAPGALGGGRQQGLHGLYPRRGSRRAAAGHPRGEHLLPRRA